MKNMTDIEIKKLLKYEEPPIEWIAFTKKYFRDINIKLRKAIKAINK